MKKTFMIALAGMMLFAFTQCGDGGNSNGGDKKGKGDNTETTSSKSAFDEAKAMIDNYAKALDKVSSCDEFKKVSDDFEKASDNFDKKYGENALSKSEKDKLEDIMEPLAKKTMEIAMKYDCY